LIIIRNSVKAIIVKKQEILMLKKIYEGRQVIYTLPGGHQEPGEALDQAVVREVYEETAAIVSVLDLIRVYEHIYPSRKEQGVVNHSVEFAFLCRIKGFYQPEMGKHPDPHQVAVEWIDIDSLKGLSFYPARLSEILTTFKLSDQKFYSGDMT